MPGKSKGLGEAAKRAAGSGGGKAAAVGATAAGGAATYEYTQQTGGKVSESTPSKPAGSTSIVETTISWATSNPEYVAIVLVAVVIVVAIASRE